MRIGRATIFGSLSALTLILAAAIPTAAVGRPTGPVRTVAPAGFGVPVEASTRSFEEIAEVVDSTNHVHIAASTGLDVWYLTDRTGTWTSRKVFKHTSTVLWGQPTIAVDTQDRVHIASTRFPYGAGDIGIFYATDKGHTRGTFPPPTRIAPNGNGEPQLKVYGGHLFLVDVKGWCCVGDGTVQMRTNVTGSWTVATIGPGQDPSFRMTTNGYARVAYDRGDTAAGLYFGVATTHKGNFVKAKIPGTGANDGRPILALKSNNAQIVWTHSGSPGSIKYTYAASGGWHAFLTVPGATSDDIAGFDVTTTGDPHVAIGSLSTITDAVYSGGTWHSTSVASGTDATAIALRRGTGGTVAIAWTDYGGGLWVVRG